MATYPEVNYYCPACGGPLASSINFYHHKCCKCGEIYPDGYIHAHPGRFRNRKSSGKRIIQWRGVECRQE